MSSVPVGQSPAGADSPLVLHLPPPACPACYTLPGPVWFIASPPRGAPEGAVSENEALLGLERPDFPGGQS